MNRITSLAENEIFVFGSNLAGRHGKGAALDAVRKFGAVNGQGTGLMGRSYGIATKDRNLRVLPLYSIRNQVAKLYRFAGRHPHLRFIVTPIGCGLAGYKPSDIAPLFHLFSRPTNVILPKEFGEREGEE